MILLSQIAFRRKIGQQEAGKLQFALPGGSATAWVGVLFLAFIIALIGYFPDTRVSLYVGFAWIVLLLLAWPLVKRNK
jgi:proline-specific permease ProY